VIIQPYLALAMRHQRAEVIYTPKRLSCTTHWWR
jgi:hypothetical protein